ncbi:MAG TPA: DUF3078 domain-containing protein [Chitinophagaceae bacterium]|jgi:hypothetical protein|nr:DUF3078 domain-containing protein [Chitinophagaceae bacterium]
MKKVFLYLCLFAAANLHAQDATVKQLQADANKKIRKEADTTGRTWRSGGIYNINLAQGSLSNWAAGGDNFSLSLNSLLSVYAFYTKEKISWDNTLDFNLGYLRSTSLGSRKNDDRIDLLSKYGYAVSSDWNLTALFNFRSQLLKGYTYPDGVRTFSSAFLSPAYILTSAGMNYKPNDAFSVFLSPVTARWVIVKDDTLSARGQYGVEPGRHSRSEFGAFVSATYIKEFSPQLSYKGRLDLFSNYKHHPQNVDLFLSNLFSVKLSKILSATWNVDLIYDDDVRLFGKEGKSAALQLKSLVGLGLLVKF